MWEWPGNTTAHIQYTTAHVQYTIAHIQYTTAHVQYTTAHVMTVYVLQECKLAIVWDQQKLLQVNGRKDVVFM